MKKVIIIGAGIGGLHAGNLLAQKGHEVTIFESHTMPGGYTAGFWRDGFYFESGTLSFESSARVFKAMKQIGVFDRINFRKHDPIRHLTPDFDITPRSYEEFKAGLLDAYPSERDRIGRCFKDLDPIYGAMKSLAGDGNAAARVRGMANMMLLYNKYKDVTLSQFARKYFEKGSKLYNLFSNLGFYPDSPPFIAGSALYSIFEDYWRVGDGMQAWADVLAGKFRESGGDLKLGSPVDRILTRNGSATGIRSMGTEYTADCIISACDYKQTFLKLLDTGDLPPEFLTRVRNARVSEGIFAVYLGLDKDNALLRDNMKNSYVFYGNPEVEFDVFDADDPDFFEKVSLSLFSPSIENPRLAPEGKSSLMIQAIAPHLWKNNWGGADREKYRQLKQQVKDTLITRASAVIPGLREAIAFEDAATPRTFERYTHNTEGATSAWSWNPHRKFYKNIWSMNVTTPLQNLFIGSCWATQIGGVPGAIMAAQACVKKIT